MDVSKFSLDYLQPSGAASNAPAQPDPWSEAVQYYGPVVLRTLQEGGQKSVADLFEITKQKLGSSDLQVSQFVELIQRLVNHGELSIRQQGVRPEESVVALPASLEKRLK